MPPPPKDQSENAASPDAAAQEPKGPARTAATRHQPAVTPARAAIVARYEQLALSSAPWRRLKAPERADRHERGTWGHALSRAGLTARTTSLGKPRKTCNGGDEGGAPP